MSTCNLLSKGAFFSVNAWLDREVGRWVAMGHEGIDGEEGMGGDLAYPFSYPHTSAVRAVVVGAWR